MPDWLLAVAAMFTPLVIAALAEIADRCARRARP